MRLSVHKNITVFEDNTLEKKLTDFLSEKFPTSIPAQEHFLSLLKAYKDSGLAEEKLFGEIFSSSQKCDEGKLWENLWEAMIYRHLSNLKHPFAKPKIKRNGKSGPDFCISHESQNIWIEATSLNPGPNFPSEWLDAAEGQARSMPHEAILLRWTSALIDKNKQCNGWIRDKIIPDNEPYVIAINSSRLSWWPSEDRGISQLPWAVEAVYPVGPLAISNGSIQHSARLSVKKTPVVDVPTAIFLDPAYNKISAIIGCARNHMLGNKPYPIDEKYYLDDENFLTVVHNPLALNPCPQNIFGNFVEYVMKEKNDSWAITRIR
jgi:hypothetical protein